MPTRREEDSRQKGLLGHIRPWWRRVGWPLVEENWRLGLSVVVAVFAAWVLGAYYGW
jgi:hypothetical protein